jgi:hypothetical protein
MHCEPVRRSRLGRALLTSRDAATCPSLTERIIVFRCEYEALLASADPLRWVGVRGNDLAGLFYTGGTTAARERDVEPRNLISNSYHWMTTVQRATTCS